jgi:hypothetical protein
MATIELTAAEAKVFKSGHGMEGFVRVQKLKKRAMRQALESGQPCALTRKGETLYTAQPLKCEVCGGNHVEEVHTPTNV